MLEFVLPTKREDGPMTESRAAIRDLRADGEELDRLLDRLEPDDWLRPTPAPGWTIAHQVAHMAATFKMARTGSLGSGAVQGNRGAGRRGFRRRGHGGADSVPGQPAARAAQGVA
jgi:uncharacterized protein (TIGR03083 family)